MDLVKVKVVPEPVVKSCEFSRINMLDSMYLDPERWLFTLQSYAMFFRRVWRRSIHSSKNVFVKASKMDPIHKGIWKDWYEFV